jgi:hypothetical protein
MSNRAISQHNSQKAGENAYKHVLRKYYITFLFLNPQNEKLRVQFLDIVAQFLAANRNNTVTCMFLDMFMRDQIFRIHLPDEVTLNKSMQDKLAAEIKASRAPVIEEEEEEQNPHNLTFVDFSTHGRPPPSPSPVLHVPHYNPLDLLPVTEDELKELIHDADYNYKKANKQNPGDLQDPAYVKILFDEIRSMNLIANLQVDSFQAAINEIIHERQVAYNPVAFSPQVHTPRALERRAAASASGWQFGPPVASAAPVPVLPVPVLPVPVLPVPVLPAAATASTLADDGKKGGKQQFKSKRHFSKRHFSKRRFKRRFKRRSKRRSNKRRNSNKKY